MPNWCNNKIIIDAKPEVMQQIQEAIITQTEDGSPTLVFSKLLPVPEGTKDEYRWQFIHYGIKCDGADIDDFDCVSDRITIECYTPWCPPVAFFMYLTQQYDCRVWLTYEEPGMGLLGSCIIIGGEMDYCFYVNDKPGIKHIDLKDQLITNTIAVTPMDELKSMNLE